jgi:hypothetical protein
MNFVTFASAALFCVTSNAAPSICETVANRAITAVAPIQAQAGISRLRLDRAQRGNFDFVAYMVDGDQVTGSIKMEDLQNEANATSCKILNLRFY